MLEPYLLLAQQVVPQVVLHSLVVVEHYFVYISFWCGYREAWVMLSFDVDEILKMLWRTYHPF
jgi:hypothetical protein